MKRLALVAATALLATGGAHAQMAMPSVSGLYGELGYTFLKIDAAGTSARPDAIRGILGYDFHPMFAGELMLAGGVSEDTKNGVVNGVPTSVDVDLKNMYGIFIKPRYVWQQAELFGRLGYAHTKVNVHANAPGLDSTQSDNDFAWGLGVNFRFNPRMYVGVDWMRYSNQSGHKVDGLTLGFGYHW